MTTEQLREQFATGEWICIKASLLMAKPQNWSIDKNPSWIDIEDQLNGYAYKLIHKKHSEVLDHVLNGGEIDIFYDDKEVERCGLNGFIDEYNNGCGYQIIKDKPSFNGSLEHEEESRICDECCEKVDFPYDDCYCGEHKGKAVKPNHSNFIKEVEKICEEPKPVVERITREEAKDILFSYMERGMTMKNANFETEIDVIFDYIEYLEANQKEK